MIRQANGARGVLDDEALEVERDAVDFESWMKMDMDYIDNWSLGLDWKLLLRTIPAVVLGRGAN